MSLKVAVGASTFADSSDKPLAMLKEKEIEVIKNPFGRRLTKAEIIKHLQCVDGLLAGLEPLDEDVFSQATNLRAIARIGIGMDNVDKAAAARHNIKVSNTPDGPTDAVAEMTLTGLLALNHRLVNLNADIHAGVWKKRMGQSIQGQKILVIGYGRIGRKVTALLSSLGADVMIYDKYNSQDSSCTIEDGLKNAAAVTLHVSGSDEVLGAKELDLMPKGAFLLNSARGGVVDEDALYERLQDGRIGGFWGDALWQEPYKGKLCGCDNAILTPHVCTYTAECREKMEIDAVKNLLNDLGL